MKIDLHSHTKYSHDALCPVSKCIRAARKRGMDAIAVTDHDTTKAWQEAREASKKEGIPVIFGEEIKVRTGGKKIGEIIGLFLNEDIRPGDPFKVIDQIRQQGGLVIIPHPFDGMRGFKTLSAYVKLIDGIEVMNARVLRDNHNEKALGFAVKNNIAQTGGSDAHSCMEIGKAYTYFEGSTIEDLRKALESKKTKALGKKSSVLVHGISTFAKIKKFR